MWFGVSDRWTETTQRGRHGGFSKVWPNFFDVDTQTWIFSAVKMTGWSNMTKPKMCLKKAFRVLEANFWSLPYFIRPSPFALNLKKEQLEIMMLICQVKNFDQIGSDQGPPTTFFLSSLCSETQCPIHWIPEGEMLYAITMTFPFCLFLLLYICCGFKSLWHLFRDTFFWMDCFRRGGRCFSGWGWQPAGLPKSHQDRATWRQSSSSMMLSKSVFSEPLQVWEQERSPFV